MPNRDLVNVQNSELVLGQGNGLGLDHHDLCLGNPNDDSSLARGHHNGHDSDSLDAPNHELGLSENQELTIVETHRDLASMDHNLDQLSVIDHPHAQLISSVLQSRVIVDPNQELAVGQEFPDVKSCRRALRDAAIACRFEIQTVKSDKTRFTAKCAAEGCPWRIHAAKLPGVPTFTIRTIHETHTQEGGFRGVDDGVKIGFRVDEEAFNWRVGEEQCG